MPDQPPVDRVLAEVLRVMNELTTKLEQVTAKLEAMARDVQELKDWLESRPDDDGP